MALCICRLMCRKERRADGKRACRQGHRAEDGRREGEDTEGLGQGGWSTTTRTCLLLRADAYSTWTWPSTLTPAKAGKFTPSRPASARKPRPVLRLWFIILSLLIPRDTHRCITAVPSPTSASPASSSFLLFFFVPLAVTAYRQQLSLVHTPWPAAAPPPRASPWSAPLSAIAIISRRPQHLRLPVPAALQALLPGARPPWPAAARLHSSAHPPSETGMPMRPTAE